MDWLKLAEYICVQPYRLTVLEPAPGAYRVRDPQANWPRADVAVYCYVASYKQPERWVCEADPAAHADHPCEHIIACMEKEASK